jgi:hypothetical protein
MDKIGVRHGDNLTSRHEDTKPQSDQPRMNTDEHGFQDWPQKSTKGSKEKTSAPFAPFRGN